MLVLHITMMQVHVIECCFSVLHVLVHCSLCTNLCLI